MAGAVSSEQRRPCPRTSHATSLSHEVSLEGMSLSSMTKAGFTLASPSKLVVAAALFPFLALSSSSPVSSCLGRHSVV